MAARANLVRKQFLVSEDNIKKLDKLAQKKGTSAANIVRLAIEAYDPQVVDVMDAPELMELVSTRLKEAIKSTQRANRQVAKTLKALGA